MIQVKNLSLDLAGKTILSDISLGLQAKQFVSIVGPNGAGKTSLLKVLAGDLHFKIGEVTYGGRCLRSLSPAQQAEYRAVLEQHQSVSFGFRVEELVEMGSYRARFKAERTDHSLVQKLMHELGISHLRQRRVNTLSGGELQRVHTARVLLQAYCSSQPERFVFLDEPISSLDVYHQYRCLENFRQLAAEGFGVVAVLHDLNIAAQFSDRIIMIREGQIYADGTPTEVLNKKAIQDVYGMRSELIQHPDLPQPLLIYRQALD